MWDMYYLIFNCFNGNNTANHFWYAIWYLSNMKKILMIGATLLAVSAAYAQNIPTSDTLTPFGFTLKEVVITDHFTNDAARYQYNQTRYYVLKIMPYLQQATILMAELDQLNANEDQSRHDKRRYTIAKQNALKEQLDEPLKQLNETQAKLLLLLIARQTNKNVFEALKTYKNTATAMKWQLWAKLNGMNLDQHYDPQQNTVLERVMNDLGYPLQMSYAHNQ